MRSTFNCNTTTDEVLETLDITGKLVVVTGGSSGLGAETARALASKGASLILPVRDVEKGLKAAAEIIATTNNPNVYVEQMNLDSLSSIRAFASRFNQKYDQLDILINNAGVMACAYELTKEGYELQFATNHLGHFLLTLLLAPALIRNGNARVVSLTSAGHRMSPVLFDDIHYARTEYNKWQAYGQSKTANILFIVELERRLGESGVHGFAVHPGSIETNLSKYMNDVDHEKFSHGTARFKTISAGAATTIYAATDPSLEGREGMYLEDCGVSEVNDSVDGSKGVRSYAIDVDNAKRLWSLSEIMVNEHFSK